MKYDMKYSDIAQEIMDIVGSYGGDFPNRTDRENCLETITNFLEEKDQVNSSIRQKEKSKSLF